MTSTERLAIEWLVACLSPGDIAPHPNFRTQNVNDVELLALVNQFRWREFQTYVEEAETPPGGAGEPSRARLAQAALWAQQVEHAERGRAELDGIADDRRASFGERAAAALLSAAMWSEWDQPGRDIARLATLAQQIDNRIDKPSGSKYLAIGALLLQAALRSRESGQYTESEALVRRALSSLDEVAETWDPFPVSRGISWTASDSQTRLLELLRYNARSLQAAISREPGSAWIELVRNTPAAASARPTREALAGLVDVVSEQFRSRYESGRVDRVVLGSDVVMRELYSSLLSAELNADLGELGRLRQNLGRVLALQLAGKDSQENDYREAIRLLRQGDAEENLKALVQQIREEGPLEILRAVAQDLVERKGLQGHVTSSDLALLQAAADLLSPGYATKAVDMALGYLDQEHEGVVRGARVSAGKRLGAAASTLKGLAAHAEDSVNEYIAAQFAETLVRSVPIEEPLILETVASLTDGIEWSVVSAHTADKWVSFLSGVGESSFLPPYELVRMYKALGAAIPEALQGRLDGYALGVALINGLLGDSPGAAVLDRVATLTAETVDSIREAAQRGEYRSYAWPPFVLAAYLVTEFERRDVWDALLQGLLDPKVSNDDKHGALAVLVERAGQFTLPNESRDQLVDMAAAGPEVHSLTNPFSTCSDALLGATLRTFVLAYSLLSGPEVELNLLRDAMSRDLRVRVAAVRGLSILARRDAVVGWAAMLLLQLSFDQDARVASHAALGIATVAATVGSQNGVSARNRVDELLQDAGVARPLGALKGLIEVYPSGMGGNRDLWCLAEVLRLRLDHPSRTVRRAASRLLNGPGPN